MTPVQAATLPLFLKNSDVVVEAPTGSGKTLSFVVPIIEKLQNLESPLTKHQVGAIIISPTRELATQIYEVVNIFIENLPLTSMILIGGSDISADLSLFTEKGGNIIVATPGRLDYLMQKATNFNVKTVEILVLDEADRLLDFGFYMTLESIISRLPKQRRTGLFSATQTRQVDELIRAGLRNPVKVTVNVEEKNSKSIQSIPTT
eukprot:TRINITY_DN941_c0_g2_i3.p1 TRINITY_DN941_c0_g2~~TRINITY_DN941_c0_g2_i3.p1  ORF type:complete len:238 (-),score=53.85 TRINITY_DN941_c0_g2_i3:92-706(-)